MDQQLLNHITSFVKVIQLKPVQIEFYGYLYREKGWTVKNNSSEIVFQTKDVLALLERTIPVTIQLGDSS